MLRRDPLLRLIQQVIPSRALVAIEKLLQLLSSRVRLHKLLLAHRAAISLSQKGMLLVLEQG